MLNINIPLIECYVRQSYLTDGRMNGVEKCVIFAHCSIPGYAPMFHCQMENGAVYYRLPISAFCWDEYAPDPTVYETGYWNSFSYYPVVNVYSWLASQTAKFKTRYGKIMKGEYVMTIDWCEPDPNLVECSLAETPTEHKCGHVLRVQDGNFYIMPNNRIVWAEPSFVVKDEIPHHYRTNSNYYNIEKADSFRLSEDNDKQFYAERGPDGEDS